MEFKDLEILLDKYFDGESTLEEEMQIKCFFKDQSNLPDELKQTKAMFDFFQKESAHKLEQELIFIKNTHKSKPDKTRKILYLITSVAASILLLFSIFTYINKPNSPKVYAYVNGKPIMDEELAKQETEKALLLVSKNLNEGSKSLKHLSTFSKAEDIVTHIE